MDDDRDVGSDDGENETAEIGVENVVVAVRDAGKRNSMETTRDSPLIENRSMIDAGIT